MPSPERQQDVLQPQADPELEIPLLFLRRYSPELEDPPLLRRTVRLNPDHVSFLLPARHIHAGIPVGPPAIPLAPAQNPADGAPLPGDCCDCCHGQEGNLVGAVKAWVAPNLDVDTSPVPEDNPCKVDLDECLGEIRDLQLWLDTSDRKHEQLVTGDTEKRNGQKDRVDRMLRERDFCFDGQARNLVRRSLVLVEMKKDLMDLITLKDKADDEVGMIKAELREYRPQDALSHYREVDYITSQRLTAGCAAINEKLKDVEAIQQLRCFIRVRCDMQLQKATCIAYSFAVRCRNSEAQVARARSNLETGLTAAMQDIDDHLLLCPRSPCVNCSID